MKAEEEIRAMGDAELSKSYEPQEVEQRWYLEWEKKGYFRGAAASTKPPFCVILPPPNVTGSLHLGHALTATIEDLLVRYKRMSGFNCLWLPGTDHAGIATQMVVEKELRKTEKKSRHDVGREEFLRRVWAWKEKFGQRISQQHRVLGASLDWSRERFTMDEGSSAAVLEAFVRLYEEGLLYRAQKLINWCPSCRTALSDLEVEHEERQGSLWHIHYPVEGSDRSLVVATTRPETMLGDTAVAVHPDDERYKNLLGRSVVLPLVGRKIPIIADGELVSMEFGTGAVKVTPGHDFNDYQTGLRHKLPMISIFDDAARTNSEAGPYAGLDRYEARSRVLDDLRAQGLLEKEEPHKLSIGTCQRCSTVVEPRLSPQWFVRIEPLAKPAIEAVERGETRFIPEGWTQTYFAWMRNIHDWCISRQLWWGHQIPAYYCLDCAGKEGEQGGRANGEPIVAREKPAACPKCQGSRFERDPDVLDTWFSSGLWPFSTLGFPKKTPELTTFYPTSVLETGHDILFFWVARMMMMGIHFMGKVPFKTVYLHAMVRDEKGEKMSKTKGNVIDPLDIIQGASANALAPSLRNKFPQGLPPLGADALRFTLASLTQQGRDIRLSLDRVSGYKAFINKLWNATRFALMNLDGFRLPPAPLKRSSLSLADRWILSRLHRAMLETSRALEEFQFSTAAGTLYQFLWYELCDWYIELAKGPLYGQDEAAKQATRAVLVVCLDRILRLLHPFAPFVTEEIWQKLPMERATPSIMLAPYPKGEPEWADGAAEEEMSPIIEAIEGIRTLRGESNLLPSARLPAEIQSADGHILATLDKWRAYLLPLAGLSELKVAPQGKKPRQAAAQVTSRMEIFVPLAGLLDFAEEQQRVQKEMTRLEAERAQLARKLENPNFLAKAPPDVVEKDKSRLEELKGRSEKLQAHLNRIAPEDSMAEEQKEQSNTETPRPPVSEEDDALLDAQDAEDEGEGDDEALSAGEEGEGDDADDVDADEGDDSDEALEGSDETEEVVEEAEADEDVSGEEALAAADESVEEEAELESPKRPAQRKATPKPKAAAKAKPKVAQAKAKAKPAAKKKPAKAKVAKGAKKASKAAAKTAAKKGAKAKTAVKAKAKAKPKPKVKAKAKSKAKPKAKKRSR